MSKKQLRVSGITNELSGASLFFTKPKKDVLPPPPENPLESRRMTEEAVNSESRPVSSPIQKRSEDNVIPDPVPVPHTVPPPVPLVRKVKRAIRQRQPFDIYEDQYERLKQIAAAEKEFENGRGMSQMVREAIDTYLKDHS